MIPPVPDVVLAPEPGFLLFLPPLLYIAAFDTSIRDVRALLRPILSLAVGLVLATAAGGGGAVHALLPDSAGRPPSRSVRSSRRRTRWRPALSRGLGVPRRLVTLLEGESLFNDATALVVYRAALAAVATAAFSPERRRAPFVLGGVRRRAGRARGREGPSPGCGGA